MNAASSRCSGRSTDADDKLKRLYRLVEDGLTDVDDVLKDRLNTSQGRSRPRQGRSRTSQGTRKPLAIQIDPALIERFGRTMRENFSIRVGAVPQGLLQSLIDVIEVDDNQIRIKGSKDLLERAVLASQAGDIPVFADEY